ncbi:MAG: FAD-binding protein [Candidatus Omnitrophota bacterium]
MLEANIPKGLLKEKWSGHKLRLREPAAELRKNFQVIVVGAGLSGSAAASSLAGLGFPVKVFCMHDTPRRSHSAAIPGGLVAASDPGNAEPGINELYRELLRCGDFRSREASTYRLAELSPHVLAQCVALGVPFLRDGEGHFIRHPFRASKFLSEYPTGGETGQRILSSVYRELMDKSAGENLKIFNRQEMMDLVMVDGAARGIISRDLLTGHIERYAADAVIIATGGYGHLFSLSETVLSRNLTALWRAYKRGAFWANPCFVKVDPSTQAAYSLGGLWVDYNLMSNVPGLFVLGEANFADHGADCLNESIFLQCLCDGYFIAPYTVSNYCAGCLPAAGNITRHSAFEEAEARVVQKINRLMSVNGHRAAEEFHFVLVRLLREKCAAIREEEKLKSALEDAVALRESFWSEVKVCGEEKEFNQTLEKAVRVSDALEFVELLLKDALHRRESCGAQVRREFLSKDGAALRRDAEFGYIAAWAYDGVGKEPLLHKETLTFSGPET